MAQQQTSEPPPPTTWKTAWPAPSLQLSPSQDPDEFPLRTCLHERWVYILGDSTARYFMHALLLLLFHQFRDPGFARYLLHDGRRSPGQVSDHDGFTVPVGCKQELTDGHGCLREFFDRRNGVRVTFVWIITAGEGPTFLESLVAGQAPDLIVTSVGAWDILNNVPPQEGADRAVRWVLHLSATYPSALVVALTPNACAAIHGAIAPWIAHFRGSLSAALVPNGTLAMFDREPHTRTMGLDACDGYHVNPNHLNIQQVLSVVLAICG